MKQEELKGIIGNHTKDGEINFEEAIKEVNINVDGLIAIKVDTAKKEVAGQYNEDELKLSGANDLIKDLGYDNKDGLTGALATAKAGDTELLGKVKGLEKDNARLTKDLGTSTESLKGLEGKVFNQTVMNQSLKAGVNKDMVEDFVKIIDFNNIKIDDSNAVTEHIGKTLETKQYFLDSQEGKSNNAGFGKTTPKGKNAEKVSSFGAALNSVRGKK